jgi:lipopolysaccharide transport system permease protein/teichoic acid transport system permease protein
MLYLRRFYQFICEIYNFRRVILELTKNDFRSRYLGSLLGVTWAFVHPVITVLILWFVFQTGFRTGPVDGTPYVIWLMCGLLPWNFFADSLSNATSSISDHHYLVKRMVFRVSILPLVKILSSLIVHIFFIVLLYILVCVTVGVPSIRSLQVFYYLFMKIILILGISWFTSAVVIFFKDLGQMITIVLQFGFWLTPIFWQLKMIPEKYRTFFLLNPEFYIVEGYRKSLLSEGWFWEDPTLTLYFAACTGVMFVLGAFMFMRLRPHFADVM